GDGRAQAPAGEPRRVRSDAAAQSRHAGGRQDRGRGVQQHVPAGARLPRAAARTVRRRRNPAARRGGDREDRPSLQAGNAPADGAARMAGDAAARGPHRSLVQDVMHVVERFAAWANDWRSKPIPPEVLHHAKRAVIDWHAALFPGAVLAPAILLEKALRDELDKGDAALALGRRATLRAAALINGTAAHTVEAGGTAALAAREGVTGSLDVIEGEAGFGRAMADGPDWQEALATLGRDFHITRMTFKNHACCGHAFAAIDGALALQAKMGLRPA